MPNPVGGFHQSEPRLLVQGGVVAEPDHHRAGIGIEIVFVVAVKQRFESGGSHHGLARAGNGGKGEGVLVGILMPALAGFLQVGQSIAHCIGLIVLQL